MEYIRNFSKSVNGVKDSGELYIRLSGADYIDSEAEECFKQGLDFELEYLNISYESLPKIVQLIFEYFNNRNIKKDDFDLDVSIVLYGNSAFHSDSGIFTSERREYSVCYKKGILKNYASHNNFKKEKYIEFEYESGNTKVESSNPALITQKFIASERKNIAELNKVIPVILKDREMQLIKVYELFYNEALDLSSLDTDKKILNMMYLLNINGIKPFPVCVEYDRSDDPYSLKLVIMIRKLKETKIVACNSSDKKMDEDTAIKIATIGAIVREYIDNHSFPVYPLNLLRNLNQAFKTEQSNYSDCADPVKLIREICKKDAKN